MLELDSDEQNVLKNGGIIIKNGTVDVELIKALSKDASTINTKADYLHPAKIGSNKNSHPIDAPIFRGDLICWVTPKLCGELHLTAMKTYIQMMIKLMKPLKESLDLIEDYSVQLGYYPGNDSGYVRHLDFDFSHAENRDDTLQSDGTVVGRKLTAILYLNKLWADTDGGYLRVHRRSRDDRNSEPKKLVGYDCFEARSGDDYTDIKPELGTLVLFRR